MRRSFKAATVFTGAAALAGGYGPAALAAPTQATAGQNVLENRSCGANNGGVSNWVHLYYPADDHPAECFGGKISTPASATIASFCPGNNNGLVSGYPARHKNSQYSWHFHQSSGRHHASQYANTASTEFHIEFIRITSWAGNAKCT